MSLTFTPATREQAKARIALAGPSGSGKTYTALITAFTLGDRVAVIDTERGSASKYVGENGWQFDRLNLASYEPQTLIQALAVAGSTGYDVVVVDSLSHFWMGTGGMLEQVDHASRRSGRGNSFEGWKEVRPVERQLIDALIAYPGHVIVTMRTKAEWVVEENDRGKKVPRKVGTRPEQREGIEYEFDIVGDMDNENTLVISKSRARLLAKAVIHEPDEAFGQAVRKWLEEGSPAKANPLDIRDRALDLDAAADELLALYGEARESRLLGAAVVDEHGDTSTLGELIVRRGKEVKADAARREAAAVGQSQAEKGEAP